MVLKVIVDEKTMISKYLSTVFIGALFCAQVVLGQVKPLDKVAAIVDDNIIMKSQLDSRVNEVVKSIVSRGGEQPERSVLVKQVLDRLILEDLQLQVAERFGVRISDEELNMAVMDVANRNKMTYDQFLNALKREGLSINTVRSQIKRDMLIERVRQLAIGERVRISDQEVTNFLSSELGKAHLSEDFYLASILVPVPQGSSNAALQKAEQQARKIYDQLQNGADFAKLAISNSRDERALEGGDIGWRKAAQLPPPFDRLVRSLPTGGFTEPVSTPGGFIILKVLQKRGGTAQMRDETKVRHILLKPSKVRTEEESRILAQRLYERVMAGENFATLAKSFSDDPGSSQKGGSLDWIEPSMLVPEFRKVMAETPINQVSRPFKTPYGWHILEVEGRRSTDNTGDYKKEQAMSILYNRKYEQELMLWLQQIREEAYVEIRI